MMRYLCLAFVVAVGFTQLSHAHNNLFVPGDAFFSTAITEDHFSKSSDSTFTYRRYSNSWLFCGYAGCLNAKITNVPKALQTTISELFKKEAGKARKDKADKVSHFPVLIYNRDFDLSAYPVGLKFNEDYLAIQKRVFKKQEAVDDRIQNPFLKKIDIAAAKKVAPLKTTHIPKKLKSDMGVEQPIEISGDDVKFVILLGGKKEDLSDHAAKKSQLEVIVIEGETVTRLRYKDLK